MKPYHVLIKNREFFTMGRNSIEALETILRDYQIECNSENDNVLVIDLTTDEQIRPIGFSGFVEFEQDWRLP